MPPEDLLITVTRHEEVLKNLVYWQEKQNGTLTEIRASVDDLKGSMLRGFLGATISTLLFAGSILIGLVIR